MMRTSARELVVAADAHEAARLEHAQQVHLHVGRHLGDLVEEQRAAVGALEAAAVLPRRAGERALLVAEQLGLDQVRRDGAAVDGDERAAAALAAIVDRPGDELLARSRLAYDEDRGRRGRHLLDHRVHGSHGRGAAVELAEMTDGRPRRGLGARNPRHEGHVEDSCVSDFLHGFPFGVVGVERRDRSYGVPLVPRIGRGPRLDVRVIPTHPEPHFAKNPGLPGARDAALRAKRSVAKSPLPHGVKCRSPAVVHVFMAPPALVPVILSGGAGTRLWPLSREAAPKPFMVLPDGETLLGKTATRARAAAGRRRCS